MTAPDPSPYGERLAQAILAWFHDGATTEWPGEIDAYRSLAGALLVVRDEELEQTRFERSYWRDLVAANLSDLLRGMARRVDAWRASRRVLEEQVRKQAEVIGEVAELLAVGDELSSRPAPTVVELARWAKAALDGWGLRLADIQAEMAMHLEVHERQQARAAADLAALRARAEAAIDLIDVYDGPYASFEDHPKWAAVREALRGESEVDSVS